MIFARRDTFTCLVTYLGLDHHSLLQLPASTVLINVLNTATKKRIAAVTSSAHLN